MSFQIINPDFLIYTGTFPLHWGYQIDKLLKKWKFSPPKKKIVKESSLLRQVTVVDNEKVVQIFYDVLKYLFVCYFPVKLPVNKSKLFSPILPSK